MYNFSTFSQKLFKNFSLGMKGSIGISVQFGVYTTSNQEKTITFEAYKDETKEFFYRKAYELTKSEDTIFSYFATIVTIQTVQGYKEILCITCSDKFGSSNERLAEVIRDYRSRITQIRPLATTKILFEEYATITHRKNAVA